MNIHIKSLLGALAFSLLFYSKSFGLNTVLISILVLVFLSSLKSRRPLPWGYAVAYLLTSLMVFVDPTAFKVFIHFMAFLVFVGKCISSKSSVYLSWFMGTVNMVIASVARIAEGNPSKVTTHRTSGQVSGRTIGQASSQKSYQTTGETTGRAFGQKSSQASGQTSNQKTSNENTNQISPKTLLYLKGTLIAGVLLILFTILYRSANPVFDDLLSQIDLSFISIPWVLFTLLGYVLFLHLLRPYHPTELINLDDRQSDDLRTPAAPFNIPQLEKLRNQQILGIMVLGALNLLLIFFLVTDVIYLSDTIPISNAAYSQSVHEGIYALMLSIVCAIAIILYFFRGDLNFYKGNKNIKQLTFLWICLNFVLVIFTGYKNYEYVEALGLTYKRIGVFVYLLLTLTGLVTAYLKVARTRSFVYLVRRNTAVAFAFLFLSAAVPWDRAITWYNLENVDNSDVAYLINLGETNSEQLYRYARGNKIKTAQDLKTRIGEKYSDYRKSQREKTWQEYTLYQLKNQ